MIPKAGNASQCILICSQDLAMMKVVKEYKLKIRAYEDSFRFLPCSSGTFSSSTVWYPFSISVSVISINPLLNGRLHRIKALPIQLAVASVSLCFYFFLSWPLKKIIVIKIFPLVHIRHLIWILSWVVLVLYKNKKLLSMV